MVFFKIIVSVFDEDRPFQNKRSEDILALGLT